MLALCNCTFDAEVEAFRAEFIAFLDEHLPAEAEAAAERSRSTSHVPEWARRWQRMQFDHGWLLPGNPPEFGGRNAGILEQFVHREELSRRRIYHASTRRASASSRRRCCRSAPTSRSSGGRCRSCAPR